MNLGDMAVRLIPEVSLSQLHKLSQSDLDGIAYRVMKALRRAEERLDREAESER